MKKYILLISTILFFIFIMNSNILAQTDPCAGNPTGAAAVQCGLNSSGAEAGLQTEKTPVDMVTKIMGYILAFIGIIIFNNMIFAGYQWITAGGNEESVTKAKEKIKNSVIGLVVILAAYAISANVFTILKDVV